MAGLLLNTQLTVTSNTWATPGQVISSANVWGESLMTYYIQSTTLARQHVLTSLYSSTAQYCQQLAQCYDSRVVH